MPRTATKDQALPLVSETADVHHIVLTISERDTVEGAMGPDSADQYIRNWLQQGYKLQFAFSLGNGDLHGMFITRVLYILVRD